MATSGTIERPNLFGASLDLAVAFALRALPNFRTRATKKVVHQNNPGDVIAFMIHKNLTANTASLNEYTDVTPDTLPDVDKVSVTLYERGQALKLTKRDRLFNLSDAGSLTDASVLLANSMADTIDLLVLAELNKGVHRIQEAGGATKYELAAGASTLLPITVGATDTYHTRTVSRATAKLRGLAVVPSRGVLFETVIHPDVSHDLQSESGTGGWLFPHENGTDQSAIYAGEIGTYRGQVFVENPRCTVAVGAGVAGAVNVYSTYTFGQEAIAEAIAEEFHSVISPVVDSLQRFSGIGWTGVGGWGGYRKAAMIITQTASSIA